MATRRTLTVGFILLALPASASAQQGAQLESPDRVARHDHHAIPATRAAAPPLLNGRLDDAVWAAAPAVGAFTQARPNPGQPASERTEVRLLYDLHAIYIGVRLFDSRPDSIHAPLARRDQNVDSDWFTVAFDTHHDRRTAYAFTVNPRGVKRDLRLSGDTQEDPGWDAVWEVATRVDSLGWTAEFRIPLSQLQFPRLASGGEMTWGINFSRQISRRDEVSHWSPILPTRAGHVSQFGELRGLHGLRPGRNLEIRPYVVSRLTRAPGDVANPFHRDNDVFGSVGADIKYAVSSNLTLTATLNPDFGQVEADPATVNLTAFESWFEEKRPFFIEGAEIFNSGPTLFYSRRIGRAPRGGAPAGAVFADAPEATRILGAAKLTGTTAGGWSIGVLNALTASEQLRYTDGTEVRSAAAEPLTSYAVARAVRDFGAGRSRLGGIFTATHRFMEADSRLAFLPSSAYTGGIDGQHRFAQGNYELSGTLHGTHVVGSDSAIARLQRAPGRYYQRPDADHLEYDPRRTSLGGFLGTASLARIGGGRWRWNLYGEYASPGVELNDLGISLAVGHLWQNSSVRFHQFEPGRHLRSWNAGVGQMSYWTSNGELNDAALELDGALQLHNHWGGRLWYMRHTGGITINRLRGGPALLYPGRHMGSVGINSDRRRPLTFQFGSYWEIEDRTGNRELRLNPTVTYRAGSQLSMSVRPTVAWSTDRWQWVGRYELYGDPRYLVARIDQRTISLTARADYTFSPSMSLQLYAEPFVSGGVYSEFRRVLDPRAARFDARFHTFEPGEITTSAAAPGERPRVRIDLDGNGSFDAEFNDPSFNRKQFRSNAVLRWEYRPGSTLFLVWSQGRTDHQVDGPLRVGRDLGHLFDAPASNVFLIKLSYWLGM